MPLLIAAAIGAGMLLSGSENESTMKNKVTTNVTNNFMQKMSTDIENSNSAELDMSQTLTFRAPFATMKNCSLTIEQNQKGTLRATMDAMAELSEEQKAELSADIASAQSQALEQANSGIPTGSDNKSDVSNEITTNVTNNLETSIEKTFKNMNFAKGSAQQDATIDLWGMQCEGSNILINQNQALEVVAENLAETISDSVQAGEAVTKVVNEQTQSVKQTNEGVSASGSSGGSSSISCSVSVIVGLATAAEAMQKKKGPLGLGGGADMTQPLVDKPSGMNWKLIIGLTVVCVSLVLLFGILVYMNAPEFPCPDEETCNTAWEEIQASKPRVPADLLRKYHNCRIKHRVNDEKPELFRPRCESYCAFVEREAETPGVKPNPFKSLFCFRGIKGKSEEEPKEEKSEDEEVDGEEVTETVITEEPFTNVPEGYSLYY